MAVLPLPSAFAEKSFPEIVKCMEALANETRKELSVSGGQVNCPQTDITNLRPRHHRRDGFVELSPPQGYKLDMLTISTDLAHSDHCHDDGLEIISNNKAIGKYHCVSRGPVNSGGTSCNMTIKGIAVQDYLQMKPDEQQILFEKCR